MQGIPRNIQTPADLENLFQMTAVGKEAVASGKIEAIPMPVTANMSLEKGIFPLTQVPETLSTPEETELVRQLNRLLGQQYHRVPILAVNGKKVTTHYFPEIANANVTEDGLKITAYVHVEAPEGSEESGGEGVEYETTEITLSATPKDPKWLSVYFEDNQLVRRGFDPDKIKMMLEVLNNESNA